MNCGDTDFRRLSAEWSNNHSDFWPHASGHDNHYMHQQGSIGVLSQQIQNALIYGSICAENFHHCWAMQFCITTDNFVNYDMADANKLAKDHRLCYSPSDTPTGGRSGS